MFAEPLTTLAVLALTVALSEWLVRRSVLRHLGSALLVILLTALWANLGVIPTGAEPTPLYGVVFGDVAPIAIFLLLLGVRLADVRKAGLPMIGLFSLGAVGTFSGVLIGMAVVGGQRVFGELHHALGGMFVGTYIGGSLNFNLIGTHYGVVEAGALYTGAVAIDSIMTALWMIVMLVLPRGISALSRRRREVIEQLEAADEAIDEQRISPLDVGVVLALGVGSHAASLHLSAWLSEVTGRAVPAVLVLTTIALCLAQVPAVARLRGPRVLGMFGVLLFLAVIGAYCDLEAFREMGALGPTMLSFVAVVLVVHGAVVFGGAYLLGADPDMAAVASQANIGGGTSALALARSLGRSDLVLPSILVGSLGTAAGTYLGFMAAELLA